MLPVILCAICVIICATFTGIAISSAAQAGNVLVRNLVTVPAGRRPAPAPAGPDWTALDMPAALDPPRELLVMAGAVPCRTPGCGRYVEPNPFPTGRQWLHVGSGPACWWVNGQADMNLYGCYAEPEAAAELGDDSPQLTGPALTAVLEASA